MRASTALLAQIACRGPKCAHRRDVSRCLRTHGDGKLATMAEPAVGTGVRRCWHSRFGAPFARELLFITALLLCYKHGRSLVNGESDKAVHHAREVIAMERDLRIFTEERLQAVAIA